MNSQHAEVFDAQLQFKSNSYDELEAYLKEDLVDPRPYKGDPTLWWRNIGAKWFPRLSYLAADLLSVPSSTASIERQSSSVGAMITPSRCRLNQVTIARAQSLRSWRASGVYKVSSDWQRAIPVPLWE
jgi:hypothetical protein